jgi:hypothetical protein
VGTTLFELNCRQSHHSYTLAKDESNEITDTRHLKFSRGIDSNFHVHEELDSSCSFMTGEGFFLKAKKKSIWNWAWKN